MPESNEPNMDAANLTDPDELLAVTLTPDVDPIQAGLALKKLADNEQISGDILISKLADASKRLPDADPAVLGGLLRLLHMRCLQALAGGDEDAVRRLQIDWLVRVITALSPEVANRHLLLHLLAIIRTPQSLSSLVQILTDSPPRGWMAAGQILSPLMQHSDWPVDSVFPALLDCLSEPSLAAPILDLAGHLVRSGRVTEHPAASRAESLNGLLRHVAQRLAKFEEDPRSFGTDVEQVQAILGEAVALAVSLCDAVGLIGSESSIPELNKAAELRHRRVQCEAAGALARLGNEAGIEQLIALAEEPSARLRAIAYADELGFGDRIDESFRTPSANAEAEVALWLSQPQQMGVPPTSVEVVDSRRMLWPSFHDPVDVFLVRFQYDFGDRSYSNIGIAGPTVFTLSADVADLPPEDIYAIYAGWHAEHEDIFTVPAAEFNEAQRRLIEPLQTHLERNSYEDVKVVLLGFFLEENAAVFTATRGGIECVVVTDGLETIDLPTVGRMRPAGPNDLFHLYKGRKMLRTFNPQGI
ncbi:HEAT repeat domain-containing protein [Aporhodopirellula aestuarii]|uniref:HEAT repeat domain-containing protein n=1 Tax=Aporhodopirellula aestuarii TaxID=2950107 RepID=A0ABT0U6S8_9BACT|nr:HEAT repeat domain-containing protein [Aporhodopirellula aestuarii]MCM2372384.1 HEAT repeat domain-containing protein [Aporhodopirellula aestuarii]